MDPLQLFLQLGIAGAILWVVYKLGSKMLDQQGRTDGARTKVIADGFSAITTKLDTHAIADMTGHREIVDRVSRFEGKLDQNLDATRDNTRALTPIEGVPIMPTVRPSTRETPRGGVPVVGGGVYSTHKRRGDSDGG